MQLPDGTIIPAYLSVDAQPANSDMLYFNDVNITVGEVLDIHYPDSSSSGSKFIEYTVAVWKRQSNGIQERVAMRCQQADLFGSVTDWFRFAYRPATSTQNNKSISNGATVMVACINGDRSLSYIIGAIPQPNRQTPDPGKEAGRFLNSRFNGVDVKIHDDGAFELQVLGATSAGAVPSANSNPNASPTVATATGVPHIIVPVNGRVTSNFGPRSDPFTGAQKQHSGIDYGAATGTPIQAAADGIVTWSGMRGGYGLALEINHGNGWSTLYGHCSELIAPKDNRVVSGQIVAKVGSTGRSTGAHLHFELRHNGQAVNPELGFRSSGVVTQSTTVTTVPSQPVPGTTEAPSGHGSKVIIEANGDVVVDDMSGEYVKISPSAKTIEVVAGQSIKQSCATASSNASSSWTLTAPKVVVISDNVNIGADNLNVVDNGVVIGAGIDTFTGLPFSALDDVSKTVKAKR